MRLYTLDGKKNQSGNRIYQARKEKDLKQTQLAAKLQLEGLQINQMAISRIENGERVVPDFELPIFAKVLGVSVGWLLGIE